MEVKGWRFEFGKGRDKAVLPVSNLQPLERVQPLVPRKESHGIGGEPARIKTRKSLVRGRQRYSFPAL